MSITKSLWAIKWALPAMAIIFGAVIFVAFKEDATSKALSTLYFKYQPTSDFSSGSVTSNSNWQIVSASGICASGPDDVACSFSISVPTGQESNYYDGSNPSSRVGIQANGSGSYYYVDDVMDNVTSSSIKDEVENVTRP
ncbi:hypothetical protein [Parafilimonas sp.]|uniref:hypothetical protein n=1 Tax=Parafilimonas sp. TaxID=1969739 RepID=UPI0039E21A55